jgi:hypothetical protein
MILKSRAISILIDKTYWFLAEVLEKKNQLIEKELKIVPKCSSIWQCGKLYFEDYKKTQYCNVQVFCF